MRLLPIVAMLALGAVGGCGQSSVSPSGNRGSGRFAGIGVFEVGRLWAQMHVFSPSADTAKARLDDDEHVIVVLDTHTGEVRQCGDHSGICVAMKPWARDAGSATLPVTLVKHESDLVAEDQEKANESKGSAR